MKTDRTKNATRNAVFGIMNKLVSIALPFLIRTVMLYIMGSEYVGLNSLFTSILSFLSLAELGVGQALVYSMYKPIAENDTKTVSALLNLYRRLYRYIGAIILAIGLALMPFLKYMVKDGCPGDVSPYILYGIYLFNTIISYWLFGYKQSLLVAHQRSDIVSKRSLVLQTLMYLAQVVVLLLFKNYYLYIILLPVFTVLTNLANSIIVDRMYPQFKCEGKVEKAIEDSIKKKVLALFGTKANSVVMHAMDNIVISAFLGLAMVGKYGNYYYIMNAIIGIMTIIYSSLTAGLGNSLVLDDREKVYRDFSTLTFMNAWMVTFCSAALTALFQPFMKIWVGEELMFGMDIVCLLVVYFYVYQIRRIILTYKDAGGVWWEDRFRPYIMMVTNLLGNFILVHYIGIYGVILSTVFAMCVAWPWETYTVFKYVFKRPVGSYARDLLVFTVSAAALCAVTWLACYPLPDGVIGLLLRGIVCLIVPNLGMLILFGRRSEFKEMMNKVKSLAKRR